MKDLKIMLIPQAGAKPEFLADLRVVDPSPAVTKVWNQLPASEIILEGYTRDGWAWKPGNDFQSVTVQSMDGRNKLSGFLSYLQQRQKACFGRFGSKSLWVVSYVQPKQTGDNAKNRMECRIFLDFTKVAGCTLKPRPPQQQPKAKLPPLKKTVGGVGGLLGKLVAGQKRTNQHMINANAPAVRTIQSSSSRPAAASNGEVAASNGAAAAVAAAITKTAAQVMHEFRLDMEQKMLDFDIAPDEVLRVTLSLPEYTVSLPDAEKPKLTMELLKYMVYEAAEEVNEEWIAHKEPTEFMDEAVIAVYKEGCAPIDVIEELNKGEMPDEVKGQQLAVQQERSRQMNQAEQRKARELESQAHHQFGEDEEAMSSLNKNKRDRRTVEDFEREKKRGKQS
mmetsp:Transcript_18931/g.24357  ORF Transcript_18931/g.24357 Transcript_18931/m.24357 type:complete len:393 (+) Transcript_18931:90-1268(+)